MKRRCDSDKCAFSMDKLQSILLSILFLSFIVTVQRSCKCICYASEKGADYPAKRQTNVA